ncbi:MAG: hypothetical protein RR565_04690 [Erysipelothrix sp.]
MSFSKNIVPSDNWMDYLIEDADVEETSTNAVTKEFLNGMAKYLKGMTDLIYPVGSIFISTKNVNPKAYLGGEWVEFGKGRTIVGVDSGQTEFNTVKKTGGHKELQAHTHAFSGTTSASGKHTHTVDAFDSYNGNANFEGGSFFAVKNQTLKTTEAPNHTHIVSGTTDKAGTGDAKNLQPYITVYMFERTK